MSTDSVQVLDHGFVRLDGVMADDLSVVNGARVSFARRKTEMDELRRGVDPLPDARPPREPVRAQLLPLPRPLPDLRGPGVVRHRIGCLTGDTIVTFVDTNGHANKNLSRTIDELWRMWTVGEKDGHAASEEVRAEIDELLEVGASQRSIARTLGVGRRVVRTQLSGADGMRDARWRVRGMSLRVLNEETSEFTTGHVADIIDKGLQPVYRLTLADGKALTLTQNHRVLTDEGWRTMGEAVGLSGSGESAQMTARCHLIVNGVPSHQDRDWMAVRRTEGMSVSEIAEAAGCSYHTVRKWLAVHDLQFTPKERAAHHTPWNKGKRGYKTRLVHSESHLAAIRAARTGSASNFWRRRHYT